MSYSVGKENNVTILSMGSRSDGITSTLSMNEVAVVQMIKLLAATLENFEVIVNRID